MGVPGPRVEAAAKAMGRAHEESAPSGSGFYPTMEAYWLAMAAVGVAAADAVEGDRPRCPRCGGEPASYPAEVYCVECATTDWPESGGGVEPSREFRPPTPLERALADSAAHWQARVVELEAALREAHRQLNRHDVKGPKQVGRAMLTIEKVLPDLMPPEIREALAAAGEGDPSQLKGEA